MRMLSIVAAATLLLVPAAASAQFYGTQPTSTNINGNTNQVVTQQNQIQNAMGNDIRLNMDAATIYESTSINGNTNQVVTQENQIQNAMGNDITAAVHAASIGTPKPR